VIQRSAVISECGSYRYRLSRWWDDGPRVVWMMMNPSTADAYEDDPTIRKCMGFARTWGYAGIEVVNLFPLRSTDPMQLLKAANPLGFDGAHVIADVVKSSDLLIAAWGCESVIRKLVKGGFHPLATFNDIRRGWPELRIECLGKSKTGNPYHPLMLAYSTPRQPYGASTD